MYPWDQDKARYLAEILYRRLLERQRDENLQDLLVSQGVAWKEVDSPFQVDSRLPSASDVVEDLYWYLVQHDPVSAMTELLRRSDLADWANNLIGDEGFYSETSSRMEMAKTILANYEIPLSPAEEAPYSLDAFQRRLTIIKDQLLQYERDGDIPDGTLRGLVLDGWSEFETLLRLTLMFWKHVFRQEFEHEWLGIAIDSALEQRSLNALVERGFKSLEQFLESGVPKRVADRHNEVRAQLGRELKQKYENVERARRRESLRNWGQDRKQAKQTLVESQDYIDGDDGARKRLLADFEHEWNKQKDGIEQDIRKRTRAELEAELLRVDEERERKLSEDAEIGKRLLKIYQHACRRRLQQPLPFDLESLRHMIDEIGFRNLYAHEDPPALETRGVRYAIDAIDALRRVGDQLVRESTCPSLVVIMGIGRDALGRELVLFAAEKDVIGTQGPRPTRVRWVLRSHEGLRPYQQYYIVSKHHFGDVDPFMVEATTILDELNQRRVT